MEKRQSVGTCTLRRIRKEKKVHSGRPSPWGSEWVEPQTGHPSPKVLHRGYKLPCLLGETLRQMGLEKPRLHSQTVYGCTQTVCSLSTNGKKSSVLAAGCHLEVLPTLSGVWDLGPGSREKTWSSYAEIAQGPGVWSRWSKLRPFVSTYPNSTTGTTVTSTPRSLVPN